MNSKPLKNFETNDSRRHILELYFKGAKHKKEIEEIHLKFQEVNLDLESFEKYCKLELRDLEKKVIRDRYINSKSLKSISLDMNMSYKDVRKLYLDGKEKMKIILSLHIKNQNNLKDEQGEK